MILGGLDYHTAGFELSLRFGHEKTGIIAVSGAGKMETT